MSLSKRAVGILSAAAAITVLAIVDLPSPVSAKNQEVFCKPKPAKPSYAAYPGSPECCTPPNYWQQTISGGVLNLPTTHYWSCNPPPSMPK
jgi:hypothetical protein